MFRLAVRTNFPRRIAVTNCLPGCVQMRGMADKRVEDAAQAAGEVKNSSPEVYFWSMYQKNPTCTEIKNAQNPSVISSKGAIGKQFNPDGNIGQVGEKIGGPFSKDGAIGSQFDASKDGIAGQVEKAVDGPARPASNAKNVKVNKEPSIGAQR